MSQSSDTARDDLGNGLAGIAHLREEGDARQNRSLNPKTYVLAGVHDVTTCDRGRCLYG
jgi:hypothetical protein